ncbi:MAG: aminotransferase class V-fold PLP-dependent enzyme [Clostridia bacterium]|nr:aminotransferase class V-fold PLP-dependent enzyme [Clostridia bacterium]
MKTPIYDFVKAYAQSAAARFHMPGHKGTSLLGCEALDITEITGADVLYSPHGIIAQSEENATALFGTGHTFYSTEGSTLAIKAMIALIKRRTPKGKKTTVLAARNVHKAFIYACALLDVEVRWIYPSEYGHLCSCKLDADTVREQIDICDSLPDAVYLTSPDYMGVICDVAGIAKVCHSRGIPLLVDNAHGAYLAFTKTNMHPIHLGADMCCDSAHKTLPVLTGGAYLHISKRFDTNVDEVRSMLSLFASTSPSYLILQSLDLCNEYLDGTYRTSLDEHINMLNKLKHRLLGVGFATEPSEPLKLVFSRSSCGYGGYELAAHLRENMIEPEFFDCDSLVLMSTPQNTEENLEALEAVFTSLRPLNRDTKRTPPCFDRLIQKISLRDAILSPSETIDVKNSVGRICASPTVSCPPAVPIVMSGEEITERAAELMLYYGIEKIEVIK